MSARVLDKCQTIRILAIQRPEPLVERPLAIGWNELVMITVNHEKCSRWHLFDMNSRIKFLDKALRLRREPGIPFLPCDVREPLSKHSPVVRYTADRADGLWPNKVGGSKATGRTQRSTPQSNAVFIDFSPA